MPEIFYPPVNNKGHAMTLKTHLAAATIIAFVGTAAQAGSIALPALNSEHETTLFVGLNWTFGQEKSGPSLRVGAIYTDIDSDDDVSGARAYFDYALTGTSTRGSHSTTVTAFKGNTDRVGEIGLGYDFTSGIFGQVGVVGDYANIGGTYGFDAGSFNGFIGLNTFEFEAVEPTASIF
jgi:hypothetical protein